MAARARANLRLPPEVNRALYVRNLPFKITAEEMYDIFGKFGAIRQVRLGNAPDTRGTAFVVYEDIYDAKNAVDHLSGFNVCGRYLVRWPWALAPPVNAVGPIADPESLTLKCRLFLYRSFCTTSRRRCRSASIRSGSSGNSQKCAPSLGLTAVIQHEYAELRLARAHSRCMDQVRNECRAHSVIQTSTGAHSGIHLYCSSPRP